MFTAHPWKEKDNACPWTCAEFWFFTVSDSTSFVVLWLAETALHDEASLFDMSFNNNNLSINNSSQPSLNILSPLDSLVWFLRLLRTAVVFAHLSYLWRNFWLMPYFLWPDNVGMWRASHPAWLNVVIEVAGMQWLVYGCERQAMSFILLPSLFLPHDLFSFQMTSVSKKDILWVWNKASYVVFLFWRYWTFHPNIFIFNVLAGHSLVIFWNFGLSLIHTHISSHQHQPQYQTLRQSITSDLPSLVCKNTYVVFFLFFLPFNFCRLCVVIRFYHPRHNGHRPPTSKDFYPRFYPLHLFSYLNSW